MQIGGPETMVIMFAILLLFGGKKLPELARGLGKGLREFKDASDGVKREIQRNINAVQNDIDVSKDLDISKDLDVSADSKKKTPATGENAI